MNNFLLLLKKEVWENWVNWKIPIILLAAVICAILGPYASYQDYEAMNTNNPYPQIVTAMILLRNSCSNLFSFLILFAPFIMMGAVAGEIKSHNAAALLIKPVGRTGYILSKWLTYFLMFGIAITVFLLIGATYANILATEANAFSGGTLWAIIGLFWGFIAFAVSAMILLSTVNKNQIAAGALGLCVLMACLSHPANTIGKLIPGRLLGWINALLSDFPSLTGYDNSWPALWSSLILSVVALFISIVIMKRKEL